MAQMFVLLAVAAVVVAVVLLRSSCSSRCTKVFCAMPDTYRRVVRDLIFSYNSSGRRTCIFDCGQPCTHRSQVIPCRGSGSRGTATRQPETNLYRCEFTN
jgi:hypothetical protein